jgi:hypothetical protein
VQAAQAAGLSRACRHSERFVDTTAYEWSSLQAHVHVSVLITLYVSAMLTTCTCLLQHRPFLTRMNVSRWGIKLFFTVRVYKATFSTMDACALQVRKKNNINQLSAYYYQPTA